MMENSRELIAWVGVAQAAGENTVFFLPHGAPEEQSARELFAERLMTAIVRFARENSRSGDARETEGATQAALLADLASDYRDHGLYSVREKIRSRHDGKPDWARTVKSGTAFPAANGAPVYCEISSTRYSAFATNIVARIQAHVIAEVGRFHGWWLRPYFGARELPVSDRLNSWPRETWPRLLRMARRDLFQSRAINLVRMLLEYLEQAEQTGEGGVICGISDFSTVWEAMLRDTIHGVENHWNALLPAPWYFRRSGAGEETGRMRTDIIARVEGNLAILDAKYYRAASVRSAPGLSDITKQIFYQQAVESTGEAAGLEIINAFLFPAEETHRDVYQHITVTLPDGSPVSGFPRVKCQYLSMHDVIAAYSRRGLLVEQDWLSGLSA